MKKKIIMDDKIRVMIEAVYLAGFRYVVHWEDGQISVEEIKDIRDNRLDGDELFRIYHQYGPWDSEHLHHDAIMWDYLIGGKYAA